MHFKMMLFRVCRQYSSSSTDLKCILCKKIEKSRESIKDFRKKCDNQQIGSITIKSVFAGMRGLKSLVCDTSYLDPEEGIRFRGYTIPECQQMLPRAPNGEQPLPEGLFWLLVTGDIPTPEQAAFVSKEWACRSKLPAHVCTFLDSLPKTVHPMAQLSAACTILNTESEFVKAFRDGENKLKWWESVYEDSMNLIGKLTGIGAKIYNNTFRTGSGNLTVDASKDWSQNFCEMLGFDNAKFHELMRLYLTIHSDHESGNVSAHACHLVGSALSDPYLSFAAGMNGLAGPLHGAANQEVLIWLTSLRKELGDDPSEEQVSTFVKDTLKSGRVIPGYGHAVLRKTDPRFLCQREFGLKHLPDDPLMKIVGTVFKVTPPILESTKKVSNPWPNVDCHSGVLLQHYGLKEMSYYTVLFGVSRALGVLAQLIWARALLLPIERPKSLTTEMLMKLCQPTSCE